MSDNVFKAVYLDRFYEKISQSFISNPATFRIAGWVLGYGNLGAGNPPALQDIDLDLVEIPNGFHTVNEAPLFVMTGNEIEVQLQIKPNDITGTHQFSMIGLIDQDGELVIASVQLPYYVGEETNQILKMKLTAPFTP